METSRSKTTGNADNLTPWWFFPLCIW